MTIWTDIVQLLIPRTCAVCRTARTAERTSLCGGCISSLPYLHQHAQEQEEIAAMFYGKVPVKRATALCLYEKGNITAQILHAMKYGGNKKLCEDMGKLCYQSLAPSHFFDDVDILLPVPLHPARLRSRGYNQSYHIARGISELSGIPIDTHSLHRLHNNQTQTVTSSLYRGMSTEHLFSLTPHAQTLAHRHVLLVDDVLTTGATLLACSEVLHTVEDIQISLLTIGKAR